MQRLLFLFKVLLIAGAVLQQSEIRAGLVLNTPAGLAAGDKFRILFVTQDTITATSSSIDTYNNFVQAQAGGATYNGQVINWKAIGSTPTVNARDNTGGFGTNVGVYLADGTQVASNMGTASGGLWSGGLLALPNQLLDGTAANRLTWTGSTAAGEISGQRALGGGNVAGVLGQSYLLDNFWITGALLARTTELSMYGLSEELTVPDIVAPVPEPATCTMFLSGIVIAAARSRCRRRKE